jgi:hypothetical protein
MKYWSFLALLFIIILWWCVRNPQLNKQDWTILLNNLIVHYSQSHIFEKIWMQNIDRNKISWSIVCDSEREPDNLLLWPIVCYNVSWYIHTYTISWMNMIIYPHSDDFIFSEKNPYILSSWDYKNFTLNNNIITLTDSDFPITIEKISKGILSTEEIIKNIRNTVISGYEWLGLSTWVNSKILSWTYDIYNFSYKKSSEVWDEIISKSYVFTSKTNIPYYYIYTDSSINDGSGRKSSMYPIELFIN